MYLSPLSPISHQVVSHCLKVGIYAHKYPIQGPSQWSLSYTLTSSFFYPSPSPTPQPHKMCSHCCQDKPEFTALYTLLPMPRVIFLT